MFIFAETGPFNIALVAWFDLREKKSGQWTIHAVFGMDSIPRRTLAVVKSREEAEELIKTWCIMSNLNIILNQTSKATLN